MNRGRRPARARGGASTRDWRYIPSVSRSSGLEQDGDAYAIASNSVSMNNPSSRSLFIKPHQDQRSERILQSDQSKGDIQIGHLSMKFVNTRAS